MAPRRYTNVDLARFERKPLGITVESPSAAASAVPAYEEPSGPTVDDLLRNAKGTLSRANQLAQSVEPDAAQLDAEQAALAASQTEPSLMDSPSTRALKSIRHYIETRPQVLDLATIPLSVVPGPWTTPALAWQGLRGGQRIAEGGMERVQEHPVLTGLDAAALAGGSVAALRGLRGAMGARSGAQALTPELLPPGAPLPRGLKAAPGGGRPYAQGPSDLPPTLELPGIPKRPQLMERNPVEGPFAQGPSSLPTPSELPPAPSPRGLLEPGRPELQLGPAPTQLPPSSLSGLRNAGRVPTPQELGAADSGSFWSGAGLPVRPTELNAELAIPYNTVPFKVTEAAKPTAKHAIDFESAMAGEGPSLEVLGESGVNASGESAASLEALQRMAGMKAKGQTFAVRKGGKIRKLTGPDAVDYRVKPGEEYGVLGPKGQFSVRDVGEPAQRLMNTPSFKKLSRARAMGTSR